MAICSMSCSHYLSQQHDVIIRAIAVRDQYVLIAERRTVCIKQLSGLVGVWIIKDCQLYEYFFLFTLHWFLRGLIQIVLTDKLLFCSIFSRFMYVFFCRYKEVFLWRKTVKLPERIYNFRVLYFVRATRSRLSRRRTYDWLSVISDFYGESLLQNKHI